MARLNLRMEKVAISRLSPDRKNALRLMKNKNLLLLGWFEQGAIFRSARTSNTMDSRDVKTKELGETVRANFLPTLCFFLFFSCFALIFYSLIRLF